MRSELSELDVESWVCASVSADEVELDVGIVM